MELTISLVLSGYFISFVVAKVEPTAKIYGCEPFPNRCSQFSSRCEKIAQADMFLPGRVCVRLCHCLKNGEKRIFVLPDNPTKCKGYDINKLQQCASPALERFELDRKLGVRCEFRCLQNPDEEFIDITNEEPKSTTAAPNTTQKAAKSLAAKKRGGMKAHIDEDLDEKDNTKLKNGHTKKVLERKEQVDEDNPKKKSKKIFEDEDTKKQKGSHNDENDDEIKKDKSKKKERKNDDDKVKDDEQKNKKKTLDDDEIDDEIKEEKRKKKEKANEDDKIKEDELMKTKKKKIEDNDKANKKDRSNKKKTDDDSDEIKKDNPKQKTKGDDDLKAAEDDKGKKEKDDDAIANAEDEDTANDKIELTDSVGARAIRKTSPKLELNASTNTTVLSNQSLSTSLRNVSTI